MAKKTINKNYFSLLYLIIVGELIFSLPFHISRFFRPSLLEEYNYTNSMLGIAFSIYGFTALISYLPGGYIADKIPAKYLLFTSLFLTSFGGFFLLFQPGFYGLCLVYGYWGITTILFFWAALIKATRNIADTKQGLFFGSLEAGRGLVASLCGSAAFLLFSNNALPNLYEKFFFEKLSPLLIVIFYYSLITFISSFIILFFFKDDEKSSKTKRIKVNLLDVLNNSKSIIRISIIVLAAYSGYKGIDYYVYYFYQVLGYTQEKSSLVITNLSYLRPVSALLAGFIADKITSKKTSLTLFIFLIISYAYLSFSKTDINYVYILFLNFILSMIAIFSLRGIFYSFLQENKLPVSITGISVGIISFIGYLPDIFIGPVFGYFLDTFSGVLAFQKCFTFLLFLSLAGMVASIKISVQKKVI